MLITCKVSTPSFKTVILSMSSHYTFKARWFKLCFSTSTNFIWATSEVTEANRAKFQPPNFKTLNLCFLSTVLQVKVVLLWAIVMKHFFVAVDMQSILISFLASKQARLAQLSPYLPLEFSSSDAHDKLVTSMKCKIIHQFFELYFLFVFFVAVL